MGGIGPIAILCGAGPHHDYLISQVAARWSVTLIVREPEARQLARLKARGAKRSVRALRYHAARRALLGLDRFRRCYFQRITEPFDATRVAEVLEVGDINAREAVAAMRTAGPGLTLVMGTSILKAEMLDAAGDLVINVHGGLLPYYRGNHCVFFALHERRPDRVGATVHFIDAGVDTGSIIDTVRPPNVHLGELPESAYCRSVHAAVDCLVGHLQRLQDGIALPLQPQPATGRTYRTRDRRLRDDAKHSLLRVMYRLTHLPIAV